MRASFAVLVVAASNLVAQEPPSSGGGFDQPVPLAAADVLPGSLARSHIHVVLDGVEHEDSLYLFRIQSDYGEYEAYGELMLRVRVREIAALAELARISGLKVAGEATVRGATESITSAVEVAKHPVATFKGLGGGISRRFRSLKRDADAGVKAVKKAGGATGDSDPDAPGESTGGLGKKLLGVNSAVRRWAGKLGVDPYTTNERLAQELERVAKIDAIAGKGSSIVAPKIPGASYVEDVHKVVTEMDPHELRDHNLNRLLEIGVPAEKAESFLELASLTPTRQTLLLSSLESLEGVANRAVVIEQALTLETEPEALFFLESVVMAGWYHTSQTPLERMVGASGVPGALAKDGRIIVFSALDYAYWTEQGAPIVSDFMKLYEGLPGRPEAWFSGGASPRFIAVAESRGWTVRTGVRSLVLAATPDFLDPLAISSDRPVTDLAKLNEPGRLTYLREAEVWEEIDTASLDLGRGPGGLPYSAGATLDCSFVLPEHPIGGKTPKFLCRDDSGTVYKVKYGRANRELYGEIIGTRLLWALGFKTDQVERVAVRCAGCPEEPWRFMNPGFLARRPALNEGVHTFDSAIIESYFGVRMQARVEQGVDWKELLSKLSSDAERARLQDVHRQALTLLASFLQHADSKAENQTLSCASDHVDAGEQSERTCSKPIIYIGDIGSILGGGWNLSRIGPAKVDFNGWRQAPVWRNPERCVAAVNGLPNASLRDTVISEPARAFLAERLSELSRDQLVDLFSHAGVGLLADSTNDGGRQRRVTPEAWAELFLGKTRQIIDHTCPA